MIGELLSYIVSGIIGSGVAATLEATFQPVSKSIKFLKVIRPLNRATQLDRPADFADFGCHWKNTDREEIEYLESSSLYSKFKDFTRSDQKILVVTGRYGTGKTYLCKYLAGRLAEESHYPRAKIPIYFDASKIHSDNIPSELISQLNNRGCTSLSLSELGHLIKVGRVVIFLDGLDQLPYLMGGTGILESIFDFICSNFSANGGSSVILVVREEFYQVSPEFQQFVLDRDVTTLHLRGFVQDNHLKKFILLTDKEQGLDKWTRTKELLSEDPNLRDLLQVPVILKRFVALDLHILRRMVSTGITLANIYRLSFEKTRTDGRFLRDLAYWLFRNDRYYFSMNHELLQHLAIDKDSCRSKLRAQGLIIAQSGYFQFEHQSFRDYFAAERILQAIDENQGEAFLSDRVIHYLVSEFVAGLLDNELFVKLVSIIDSTTNDLVKNNIIDIVSEVEDEALRSQAASLISERIKSLNFDSDLNEYQIFLAAIGGIFGFREPVETLVDYAKSIGIGKFTELFFITKNGYEYYSNSQDCWLLEWLKALPSKKYGYTRLVLCYMLGEMKAEKSIPHLKRIILDSTEDILLRQYAHEALKKLVGETNLDVSSK
ncbi:MAG TPA: AAA family ATPase [Pyrinomonadaceae bacterium]|nr:AAA family ATPase [Pyrinomonadaceae bacterium]